MKKHYEEINLLRGMAMLLVVGHSFDKTDTFTFLGYIHSSIYCFHIPLFFVISGFQFYKSRTLINWREKGMAIREKFLRLVIPFGWSIV